MRFGKSTLVFMGVALIILHASFSFGQSPAISNGLSYLQSSQTSAGYWGDTNEVLYNSFVETCAISQSLNYIGGSPTAYSSAIQWINTIAVANNDYLTAKMLSLSQAGIDASSIRDYLLSVRNNDGGWSVGDGITSDIKRTALMLQALKAINYSDAATLYQAVTYLTSNQNSDGGWGYYPSGGSDVFMTATVLKTLALYNGVTFNVQSSIDKAVAYLLSKQNTDGGFGSSPSKVYETAVAFDALVATGKNISSIAPSVVNYLTTIQLSDGSWNEDPYSTALALRALANVKPNLAITSSNIAFSNSMPALGGTVAVTATVKNTGFEPVSNVVVNFYDHDPTSGAPAIASKTIAAIPAGGSALASIPYVITTTGMSSLFVVLDPSNQIDEITKLDNTASNRLWGATIPDLAVFSSDLKPSTYTPASNTAFTLQYAVRNLGESATNGFDVAVYDGSPTGTPLQTGHISGIGGTETRTGTFGVTLTGDGPHTLYIVADPGNAITETTKTNNTTRWKRT